jgi:hypothetical protein
MGVGKGTCWCVLALLPLASCLGAKSDLWEPPDVPVHETHPRDDARADDGAPEAEAEAEADADADVPEVVPCGTGCNDGSACTEDRCDPVLGCIFTPIDARCDDGIACTTDRCVGTGGVDCAHDPVDARCDDGIECTADVCVSGRGCVSTSDLELCDDGFDCTEDGCDWATGRCTHRPDDAACNDYADCTTDRCDVDVGCVYVGDDTDCPEFEHCDGTCHGCALDPAPAGRFLAFTLYELFRIDPVAMTSEVVRDMGYDFRDLAVTPDDRLWGSTDDELASIEPCALHGRILYRFATPTFGALGAGADGWLYYISTAGEVRRVQPDTFVEERVAAWPLAGEVVADIAAGAGGILYTASRSGSDPFTLYGIDPAAGTVTPIGSIGPWNVEALAFVDGVLYGLSAEGDLLRIDTSTGAGVAIGTIPPGPFMTFVGAASPPP